MSVDNGVFATSAVLNVVFGTAAVFFYLKMRRERESHMRQLHILYDAYMKARDKLIKPSVSDGHMLNPAFDLEEGNEKVDNTESSDLNGGSDGISEAAIQDSKRPTLSPWNNFSARTGKVVATRGSVKKKKAVRKTDTQGEDSDDIDDDSDDEDTPPGLTHGRE